MDTDDRLKVAEAFEFRNGSVVWFRKPADPKCKICYGVGHIGRDAVTKEFVPCKCAVGYKGRDNIEGKE